MKYIKKNIKLIVGILIGLVISVPVAYAAGTILFQSSQVSFDNTRANLTKVNGDPVETVEEAVEALARNNTGSTQACSNSPFHLGDYIDMTPTSTSYTPDRTLTGLVGYDDFNHNSSGTTAANTLNPSYLNVWRVIKINQDCSVEVVSEYASDVTVKFAGKIGYQNNVYVLQDIAKQYANTTYTLNPSTAKDGAFRNVGYSGQTKQITDTSRIDDLTIGGDDGLWYKKVYGEEELGGGDIGYAVDLELLYNAGVPVRALSKGSSVSSYFSSYWLTSRIYYWSATNYWSFCLQYYDAQHYLTSESLFTNSASSNSLRAAAIRPIVTLKPGLSIASGNGTESSHYTLSVS